MAKHIYLAETPEQLLELYAIQPEGNRGMENLARVWRAERAKTEAEYPPHGWARVEFEAQGRKCRVIQQLGRAEKCIGELPYNRALACCRRALKKVRG